MKTPITTLRERNVLSNVYRREAKRITASPTRQGWYIAARLKGASIAQATMKAKKSNYDQD